MRRRKSCIVRCETLCKLHVHDNLSKTWSGNEANTPAGEWGLKTDVCRLLSISGAKLQPVVRSGRLTAGEDVVGYIN